MFFVENDFYFRIKKPLQSVIKRFVVCGDGGMVVIHCRVLGRKRTYTAHLFFSVF